jgi:small nuclear ribonucleoprotein (snRNP)-like protein
VGILSPIEGAGSRRGSEERVAVMLEEMIGQKIVVDLRSEFVCLGTLVRIDEHFLELRNADLHDLRDTDTTRENYVAESHATGIKRNRKRVLLLRAEMVAIARLEDVVAD